MKRNVFIKLIKIKGLEDIEYFIPRTIFKKNIYKNIKKRKYVYTLSTKYSNKYSIIKREKLTGMHVQKVLV